jgi:hypothetical protein
MTLLEDVAILPAATLYASLGEWFGALCLLITVVLGFRSRAVAGNVLSWKHVGIGVAALVVPILIGVMIFDGPSDLVVAARLLAHMPVPGVSADEAFHVGVTLVPLSILGSLACGALVRMRGGARQEIIVAILAILAVPALVLGTLEGEQAGLVIGALIAIALGFLGARFTKKS